MNSSLRARLFTRTLVMLAITLAVVFSGTQLIARNSLQKAQDNALQAVAQVIADSVTRENGQLTFDLPFEAFEVLAYQSQEALAYQVSDGERILAGAEDLPLILPRVPGQLTHAYTQVFNSEAMRFFYLNKPIRGTQSIAIVIGQTQTGLVREVNGLALQAAAFCLVAFLLVSGLLYGVLNLALRPLRSIEKALAKRADDDFSKLDTQVPKEISTLLAELNRVMGTHEKLLEQSRRFIAEATHQLRTPIAALAARADLIARNAPSEFAEDATELAGQARETSRLSHQLLTQATLSYRTPEKKPCDPRELIQQTLRRFDFIAEQRDIEIHFQHTGEGTFLLDPLGVREALACLLENALQVTPTLGDVWISSRCELGCLTIKILDQGPGFSDMPNQGLGLSIVKQVADNHDGAVTFNHGPQGGAECELLLRG